MSSSSHICVQCADGYVNTLGTCALQCNYGYQLNAMNPLLCTPIPIDSSDSLEHVIYVHSAVLTGNVNISLETDSGNAMEDGSESHPYHSLAQAFANVSHKYTTILLNEGTHLLIASPVSAFLASATSSPSGSIPLFPQNLIRLTVAAKDCEVSACVRPVLKFLTYIPAVLRIVGTFELRNVNIDGNSTLVQNCSNFRCFYPAYSQLSLRTWTYVDDRDAKIDTAALPQGKIPNFSLFLSYSLISTWLSADVLLENVTFANFRQGFLSLIQITNTNLTMRNVDFLNIVNTGQTYDTYTVILQQNNIQVNIYYEKGSVQLLNNGFEYRTDVGFGGFLALYNSTLVVLSHIRFSYNLIGGYGGQSLMLFKLIQKVIISDCIFENNIVPSGMLVNFILEWKPYITRLSELPNLLDFQIDITNCVFRNNSVVVGNLVQIGNIGHSSPNIQFRNIFFENELAVTNELIWFDNYYAITAFPYQQVVLTSNHSRVRVDIPPGYILLKNLTLVNCYGGTGLITAFNVIEIDIQSVTIKDCAFSSVSFYENTLLSFTLEPRIYMRLAYPTQVVSQCGSGINVTDTHRLSIADMNIANISCRNGTGGIALSNINQIALITDSYFRNVLSSEVLSLNTSQATLYNVSISNSRNQNGNGVIYAFGRATTLDITHSLFRSCKALYGGVAAAIGLARLSVKNSTFILNEAVYSGGALWLSGVQQFFISDSEFINTSASTGGVISFELSTETLSLYIQSSIFQGNMALTGSVAYLPDLILTNESMISGSRFQRNIGGDQGVLYLQYTSGLLTVSDCFFEQNTALVSAVIYGNYQSQLVLRSSVFQSNIGQVLISLPKSNVWQTCTGSDLSFYSNVGASFSLISSAVSCTKCRFVSNRATSGPVLYLESGSTATMILSNFTNNTSTGNGGVTVLRNKSIWNATSCLFLNNTSAGAGGVLYFELQSHAIFVNSLMGNNTSTLEGSTISAVMNSVLHIENSKVVFNDGVGVISLLASEATVTGTDIRENTSSGSTAGIVLMFSTLTTTNSAFANQTSQQGTFISAYSLSTVFIQSCSFLDGAAETAGGAVSLSESQASITNSTFQRLTATYGSAIMSSINSFLIVLNTEFSFQVSQQPNGGTISTFDSTVQVINSSFSLYNEGALSISRTNLEVTLGYFGCNAYTDGKGSSGSAVYSANCFNVSIVNSTFISLSSEIGGSLYFSAAQANQVTIIHSIFSNNSARDSGAVFADQMNIQFIGNYFTFNRASAGDIGAESRGGAVTLLCSSGSCQYSLHNNTFIDNTALLKGGAIYWGNVQPNITADNIFSGNKAAYGNDIASFAINLVSMNATYLQGVASGQPSNQILVLQLLDHYKQVVSADNTSLVYISTNSNGTEISGEYKTNAVQGVLTFRDFIIVATPKQFTLINVTSSQPMQLNTTYVEFNVSMRDCIIGESLINNQCVVCPPGKYSLNPKLDCQKCPEGAECLGNFTMLPKPGYWRSGNHSDVFFVCPNQNACLGSTDFTYPTGVCDTGYEGNKCEACSSGYSQYSKIYCLLCPNIYLNAFRIFGFLILLLVFAIVIVKSSFKSATRLKSKSSIYLKILMNYIQLSMLMSALNLNWPNIVLQLFEVHDSSGSMVDQVISVDCLLSSQSESDAFFIRLILMSLIPIIFGALSLWIWLGLALLKHSSDLLRNECVATIVILFFIVHPSIARLMFKIFHCEQIDPGEYWVTGYDIRCWESSHLKYSLALALPSLIIWGIGVPALCWLYLRRNRYQLHEIHMRVKFGYLYNMYDSSKYYWEFIILYRKLVLISVTIFLSSFSIISQAIIVLGVLLIYQLLQYKTLPYTIEKLNELELRCLWVSIITINSGLFFYSNQLDEIGKVLFVVLIVAINCHFLILWVKVACAGMTVNTLRRIKLCRRWFPGLVLVKVVRTPAF